jgi:GntR family transcriptional regulator
MRKDTAIPLYYQLEMTLRKKIESGVYGPGTPLPSEDAMRQEYGVSRVTVRQALAGLEKDGLIVRWQGKRTFVSERLPGLNVPKLTGTIEEMVAMGILTKVKLLSMESILPPSRVKERLGTADGEEVLRIDKLRLINQEPFSHVTNYLPHKIGLHIRPEMLDEKPLLMILEADLGLRATEADQSLEAAVADAEMADLLEVPVGAPLLKVERTVYDARQNPIEHVSVLYRGDKYTFTVKLRRAGGRGHKAWDASLAAATVGEEVSKQ